VTIPNKSNPNPDLSDVGDEFSRRIARPSVTTATPPFESGSRLDDSSDILSPGGDVANEDENDDDDVNESLNQSGEDARSESEQTSPLAASPDMTLNRTLSLNTSEEEERFPIGALHPQFVQSYGDAFQHPILRHSLYSSKRIGGNESLTEKQIKIEEEEEEEEIKVL
jgi:hypothetical protein